MLTSFDDAMVARLLEEMILPFGEANSAILDYHRVFIHRYANTLSCLAALPRTTKTLELAAKSLRYDCHNAKVSI